MLERLSRGVVPLSALELEVTETGLLTDLEANRRTLERLYQRGVSIAIDDFGTGYSSLAYLRHLPVNTLKIDRAFVEQLSEDPADQAIVQAIIEMAHSLGVEVVAEGVDTDERAALLTRMGCDIGQGYLFGRPVPAEQFPVVGHVYTPGPTAPRSGPSCCTSRRTDSSRDTATSSGRTSRAPCRITKWAPSQAPVHCPAAMARPTVQATCPPTAKTSRAAKLLAKLSSLLPAVARRRSQPAARRRRGRRTSRARPEEAVVEPDSRAGEQAERGQAEAAPRGQVSDARREQEVERERDQQQGQ